MTGIALKNFQTNVKPGKYIHTEHEHWSIYSDVPLNEELLRCPVLEEQLPGRLGEFMLPEDAVFRLNGKKKTTVVDLKHYWAIEEEHTVSRTEVLMKNHFSVRLLVRDEEEECYEEDDADEEEDDEEEENDDEEELEEEEDDGVDLSDVESD